MHKDDVTYHMDDETFKHLLEKHLPEIIDRLLREGRILIGEGGIYCADIDRPSMKKDIT